MAAKLAKVRPKAMPIQLLRCRVMSFQAAKWAAVWPGGKVGRSLAGRQGGPQSGRAARRAAVWRSGKAGRSLA